MTAIAGELDAVHRNLMINFIPNSWTSNDLHAFFQQFGAIEDAKVPIDKSTGASKGYGFVKFVNRQDAETALSQAQGLQIEGSNKPLKIQKAALGKMPPGPVSLYIAGFDPTCFGLNDIQQLMASYGNVANVKIIPSKPGKKGVAFVTLESWAEATAAVEALNGAATSNGNGETLVVRIAESSAQAAGLPSSHKATPSAPPLATQRFQPYVKRPAAVQTPVQYQVVQQVTPRVQQVVLPQAVVQPKVPVTKVLPVIQQLAPHVAPVIEPDPTIFVYGVPGMDDAFLYKLFGQFGAITSANVPEGKNFGFVKMPNFAEAQTAVNTLNGCMLQGATVPLQVSFKGGKK